MAWSPGRTLPPLLGEEFPLPPTAPFSTREAAAAGVSRNVLARLVEAGLLRRMLRGIYVAGQTPDSLALRARALSLTVPTDAAVTDWTACWLHTGILPPGHHLEMPPVSLFRFAGRARVRNQGCRSGERSFLAEDLTVIDGVTVTTPLRTALDLGRLAPRDWAIGSLDGLLRVGMSKQELLDNVERFRRQRGVVQLRELAPLSDPRSESPGESVLRLRWHDLPTLPQPEPQVSVRAADGREIYRIDLAVRALRFGVEYDGEQHHSTPEDRAHDARRRLDLARRFGWLVLPATKDNIFGSGRDVERIIHEGVREARRRLGELRRAS